MADEKNTIISGSSDDILMVESVHCGGEIDCFGTKPDNRIIMVVSDGTILAWHYSDPGIWRCDVLKAGSLFSKHEPCPDPEGNDQYTDIVTLHPGVEWVMFSREKAKLDTGKAFKNRRKPVGCRNCQDCKCTILVNGWALVN